MRDTAQKDPNVLRKLILGLERRNRAINKGFLS
jgi:hypothetical protein